MNAIKLYRIGHYCSNKGIPIIPSVVKFLIFFLFNSIVPSAAVIGKGTRFMYGGIGSVIHARAVIGENVALGQCITIGRKLEPGAPVIGNDVYIAAGARILGNIRIGNNVIIGANSVVLTDIPDNSIVAGVPARVVKTVTQNIYEIMGDIL